MPHPLELVPHDQLLTVAHLQWMDERHLLALLVNELRMIRLGVPKAEPQPDAETPPQTG